MNWFAAIAREIVPISMLLILLIFLLNNARIDRQDKANLLLLIGVEFAELLAFELELWTASFAVYSPWRLIFSVIGYVLRPLMLLMCIRFAIKDHIRMRWRLLLWLPALVNAACYTSAFFTPLSFYFTPSNHFMRGPLSYMVFIVSAVYLAFLLYVNIRYSRKRSRRDNLLLFIIAGYLIAAIMIDFWLGNDLNLQRIGAVTCTFVYYALFQGHTLSSLIDNIPSAVASYVVKDGKCHLESFNDTLCISLGLSREKYAQLAKKSLFPAMLPESQVQAEATLLSMQVRDVGEVTVRSTTPEGMVWTNITFKVSERIGRKSYVYATSSDVTKIKQAEVAQLRHEEELSLVVAQSGKSVVFYDLQTRTLTYQNGINQLFGLPQVVKNVPDSLLDAGLVLPESKQEFTAFFEDMLKGIPQGGRDFHVLRQDGTQIWHHSDYTLQQDEKGNYTRSIISFSDVTEQIEQRLMYEGRIKNIIALARDCDFYIEGSVDRWIIEKVHVVGSINAQVSSVEGKSLNALIDQVLSKRVHPNDIVMLKEFLDKHRLHLLYANSVTTDKLEFRLQSQAQEDWRCVELALIRSSKAAELSFIAIFKNINSAHAERARLVSRATTDKLTGLLNREATMQSIELYLAGEGISGTHALLMLDLDNLKNLNDSKGHQIGDDALQKLGHSMRSTLRRDDIVGRVGGDEFFALVKDINSVAAANKAEELLANLQFAYSSEGDQIITSASIGISMYYGDRAPLKTLKMLYAEADAALYRSKARGKNTYTFAGDVDVLPSAHRNEPSQTEAVSYNLRGVLNNLANGIAVFHDSGDNDLTPVFCNESLLELLEIKQEQFHTHLSLDNCFAIHPEDMPRVFKLFTDSAQQQSFHLTFRIRKGDGEYRWVSVLATRHMLDANSSDLYIVYTDAGETESLRRQNEERYRRFVEKWATADTNSSAHVLLNITRNSCSGAFIEFALNTPVQDDGSVDLFLEGMTKNIASSSIKQEFLTRFSLDTLRGEVFEPTTDSDMTLPLLVKDNGIHWYRFSTYMSINPDTSDTEVIATLTDIDKEIRLEQVIDRMLQNEYELVLQIDVESFIMTVISGRMGNSSDDKFDGRNYSTLYADALCEVLEPEYLSEGIEAIAPERVLEALRASGSYTCVFPAIATDRYPARICQWRFEFVDETQDTMLLTRANISPFLEDGYDPMTGLLDRRGFYQRVRRELDMHPERNYRLIEVNFDGFKLINEEQGYDGGNRFLRRFGADLRRKAERFGRESLIARLESDHFISLRPSDSASPEEIYTELASQVKTYPEAHRLTLRMGVYEITDPSLDVALMCDCAQIARRTCNGNYSEHMRYYTNELRDKMLDEQLLASEMQRALNEEQFEIFLQPQMNNTNGSLIGAEALVRWNHPERGRISPMLFIPMFEQNGFIYELDKYVWQHSCMYLRRWIDEGLDPLPISVNVSRLDLAQPDCMDAILDMVEEYKIPRDLLHLEVTESALTEGSGKVVDVVKALIEHGFVIAIDDFGSGFSSLSMLKSVPAHMIKLDMRFFEGSSATQRNKCIIESVIRMAKMLSMSVIAEGVEELEQAKFLQSVGCNYIQGYLYSKPLSVEEYLRYADKAKHEPMLLDAPYADSGAADTLFRSIITESKDIVMVLDRANHELLYANHVAESFYQHTFDPMHPVMCYEFRGLKACNRDECSLPDLNYSGSEEEQTWEGDTFFHIRYHRIEWNGRDAVVMFKRDHTAEEKEAMLTQSLIQNVPGALVLFAPDGKGSIKRIYTSEQAATLLGPDSGEGEAPTLEECMRGVHPDDYDAVLAKALRMVKDNCPVQLQLRLRDWDGTYRWRALSVNPVCDAHGAYLYYGLYTDISAQKNAQERVNELIEHIPTALTVFSEGPEGGERIFVSEAAKELLGLSKTSAQRTSMEEAYARIHPEDQAFMRTQAERCVKNKESVCSEFRIIGEDGRTRWLELRTTPMRSENGEYLYYGVYTDIAAKKRMEEDSQLRQDRRNEIYQQMINDEANVETERLLLRVHLDLTAHEVLDGWCDESEYTLEDIGENGSNVMDRIFDSVIGEGDRKRMREIFSKKAQMKALNAQGYVKSSFEYMCETKSGRIALVRTQTKLFIDPDSEHRICYIMTYDIGSVSMPATIQRELLSPDLDNVSLYNTQTGVMQVWDLDPTGGSQGRVVKDYPMLCNKYCRYILPEDRQRFMKTTRMDTALAYLRGYSGTYRFSFPVEISGVRRYKTWEYYYLRGEERILVITCNDTTEAQAR